MVSKGETKPTRSSGGTAATMNMSRNKGRFSLQKQWKQPVRTLQHLKGKKKELKVRATTPPRCWSSGVKSGTVICSAAARFGPIRGLEHLWLFVFMRVIRKGNGHERGDKEPFNKGTGTKQGQSKEPEEDIWSER